ncbi:hypothetical protein CNMCM5793_003506 [Aspergillus hiratsukae]|uniref:Uncharacterized protein n=1 Tax=Aspergillus hiratsukae TaxID=1194566 RepID=A0A8H6PDX8_9EURO|nr:hypothetical protein CNMCM5793_003506 [Aspergillus hiratsukae]KAF7169308.1 hypothetical protein CNMCM6106_004220 [Aspergillus hiratsukae]
MKSSYIPAFLILAAGASASLHNIAVCVTDRQYAPIGGTAWSVSYNWAEQYTIDTAATQCACNFYRNRNTGSNWWDTCTDCYFDGTYCNSPGWHIGGDEMNYYCHDLCHTEGSEANPSNCKNPPCA